MAVSTWDHQGEKNNINNITGYVGLKIRLTKGKVWLKLSN